MINDKKTELLELDRAELSLLCEKLGQSAFRGKQIAEWLYTKGVREISEMTNLPAGFRDQLATSASITRSKVIQESKASDQTLKLLLQLADSETIESVLLPYPTRTSVCVSTQVGCRAGCVFCATGQCGFVRNLEAHEIVDQVLTAQERAKSRVTHVVYMGMGEPLLNTDNVVKSLHILNDEVGIAMRHLTISSIGIIPEIRKLKELDLQITLAISLHAADDALRHKLVPLSVNYPLDELMSACRNYADFTKRRITFEYLMLAGINDSVEQAIALTQLLKHTLCNVNLIAYNEVEGKHFIRSSRDAIKAFRNVLEEAGIEVTQRFERGHAVLGACGQLRRRQVCGEQRAES